MTALWRCDGCDGIMADEAPRIAIELVNEPVAEATDDDLEQFAATIELKGFGFVGSHHFCQMSCLSAWAMGRAVDDIVSRPPFDGGAS